VPLSRRDSSLPPSSPPAPFSDTDGESADERDAVRDVIDAEDEDEEGEDLFGPGIVECGFFWFPLENAPAHDTYHSDYAENEQLDTYSNAGLNDEEIFEPMSAAARRAAEAKMRQRDRMERGSRRGMRAATRSHAPSFFDSDGAGTEDDDESGLLSGTRTRARRQYDERRDVDDMEGIEDVCFSFCSFAIALYLMLGKGSAPGTVERYQGEIDRRVDCQ
jgi:DNA replication licensing factor MCM2